MPCVSTPSVQAAHACARPCTPWALMCYIPPHLLAVHPHIPMPLPSFVPAVHTHACCAAHTPHLCMPMPSSMAASLFHNAHTCTHLPMIVPHASLPQLGPCPSMQCTHADMPAHSHLNCTCASCLAMTLFHAVHPTPHHDAMTYHDAPSNLSQPSLFHADHHLIHAISPPTCLSCHCLIQLFPIVSIIQSSSTCSPSKSALDFVRWGVIGFYFASSESFWDWGLTGQSVF